MDALNLPSRSQVASPAEGTVEASQTSAFGAHERHKPPGFPTSGEEQEVCPAEPELPPPAAATTVFKSPPSKAAQQFFMGTTSPAHEPPPTMNAPALAQLTAAMNSASVELVATVGSHFAL